jgi:hypothetical protein
MAAKKAGHRLRHQSQPLPGTPSDGSPWIQRRKFQEVDSNWQRREMESPFEQLPTTFHVVSGMANLDILEYVGAEMVEFSAPGIAVSANTMRAVIHAE